jgi:hypothetical protein
VRARAVPTGLVRSSFLPPGTSVPGFRIPPFWGWNSLGVWFAPVENFVKGLGRGFLIMLLIRQMK